MATAFADSPATGGVRSLEVRWILPGQLESAVAGWFGRFPVRMEYRQDSYLLDPALDGLSVKVRAGRALEVKVYRGSRGVLEVTGRARGHIQSWQKWSFPGPLSQGSDDPASWRPVGKTRRTARFCLADGRAVRIDLRQEGPDAHDAGKVRLPSPAGAACGAARAAGYGLRPP